MLFEKYDANIIQYWWNNQLHSKKMLYEIKTDYFIKYKNVIHLFNNKIASNLNCVWNARAKKEIWIVHATICHSLGYWIHDKNDNYILIFLWKFHE